MKKIYRIFMILFGCLLYALGLNAFTIANNLAEGGFTGIAILLHYIYDLPTGWVLLILNIPLFIISIKYLGRKFMAYTVFGTVAVSVFIELTASVRLPTDDLLLAALYAGVTTGLGLGIIFRNGATTAGADIIARLLQKHVGISLGQTIFTIDILVIAVSALFLGNRIAMYSLVGLFITSRVIDFVQEGAYSAKAVLIISNKSKDVTHIIHTQLGRGTTLLEGRGGYTGNKKDVLLCVVSRSEVVQIKNIVQAIDSNAFVIVSDAREVSGEGFAISEK